MFQFHLVAITRDVDCDGTFYAAHRVPVPASQFLTLKDDYDAFRSYVIHREDVRVPADDISDIMTVPEFLASANLDDWSREYFHTRGYANDFANVLAPWVRDDSIGIPALDHTYEEDPYFPSCPICHDPIDYCQGHGSY